MFDFIGLLSYYKEMKYVESKILKQLNKKFNESLKYDFEKRLSKTTILNKPLTDKDYYPGDPQAYFDLTPENLFQFIDETNPYFFHKEDKFILSHNQKEVSGEDLSKMLNKDFFDLAHSELVKENNRVIKFLIQRKTKENSKKFKNQLKNIVKEYCQLANKEVERILKEKVKENVIYRIFNSEEAIAAVFDGPNLVMAGEYEEFQRADSNRLSLHKNINLEKYNCICSCDMARILSMKFKKKIVNLEVSKKDFEFMVNGLYNFKEKKEKKSKTFLEELWRRKNSQKCA